MSCVGLICRSELITHSVLARVKPGLHQMKVHYSFYLKWKFYCQVMYINTADVFQGFWWLNPMNVSSPCAPLSFSEAHAKSLMLVFIFLFLLFFF